MDSPMIKFSEDVTNEFHYACVNSELDKVHKLLTKHSEHLVLIEKSEY